MNTIKVINLPNIKINTIYLNKLTNNCIILKNGLNGIKFNSINKKILHNSYNELYELFTNFKKPMYETLLESLPVKIYLDCDFYVNKDNYNNKYETLKKLNNYFIKFLNEKKIKYKEIIYLDSSRTVDEKCKISFHIIVNGALTFKDRKILKNLIIEFKNSLINEEIFFNSIDTQPYNYPQLFKCVLSPSKNDNTLLIPYIIKDDKIIKIDTKYIIKNLKDFLVGDYDDDKDKKYLDDMFLNLKNVDKIKNISESSKKVHERPKKVHDSSKEIPENTRKWLERNYYIKNIYKIRSNYIINDKIDLKRINPYNCNICERFHENENAYCMVRNNVITFHCGRNPKKFVIIGNWYTNYKKQNKNIENNNKNQINVLNDIIKDLKIYIVDLENKYESLKKDFNLLSNNLEENIIKKKTSNDLKKTDKKNNKNIYTKDITSGMWTKYYTLGLSIENKIDDIYNNIISHWNDKYVDRLKKRGIRIYKYINFLKETNQENNFSLREIFNLKIKEFNNLLIL